MRMTRGTDYALLLLLHLAGLPEKKTQSVVEIARSRNLPRRFLANIVSKLVQAGLIHSERGGAGGIRLARSSAKITLREVIEAIEGPIQIFDCHRLHYDCHLECMCSSKSFWDGLQAQIVETLEGNTLSDVLQNRGRFPLRRPGADEAGGEGSDQFNRISLR